MMRMLFDDHVDDSITNSSKVVEAPSFLSLLNPEMEVFILNRKGAKNFFDTYQKGCSWESSEVNIKDHIAHGARPDVVSWINPFGIFKDDEIPLIGVTLLEMDDARKYI